MKLSTSLPLLMFCATVHADVLSKGGNGFEVQHSFAVHVETTTAWKQLLNVQRWWHPDHTWSGNARNLTLKAEIGACFCETLPNRGQVQHQHVIYAEKNRLLRLRGALGPLQEMAVDGVMTWELLQGKDGTQVTMTYRVFGYHKDGLHTLADPVDQVLKLQIQRFHDHLQKMATH